MSPSSRSVKPQFCSDPVINVSVSAFEIKESVKIDVLGQG